MAEQFGMGMMGYSPLAGGLLTGKYRQGALGRLTRSATDSYQEDERTKSILDELILVANELNVLPGQIALAWVMSKGIFPIIGARTLSHLETSLNVLDINLDASHIARLDEVSRIAMGYPHELLTTVQTKY